jgi:hypothetical protein
VKREDNEENEATLKVVAWWHALEVSDLRP